MVRISLAYLLILVGCAAKGQLQSAVYNQSQTSPPVVAPPEPFVLTPAYSQFYLQRYHLPDVYTKLVNNSGDGFDALYGTRNFREVLRGLVYRGGANNAYNKHVKRSNSNPLPTEGLVNLCTEGFSTAIYLYTTNFSSAPHKEDCTSIRGGTNHLDYVQQTGLNSSSDRVILKMVYDLIHGVGSGPIYLHCWNGWHSSGFISALILRQFCDITADQAVSYWNANTDGNNGSGYDSIRKKIRAFVPDPALTVDHQTQLAICH